ncbi:MAG: hypothetical protein IPK82_42410 [Polyangiaceae bacterium]|nr:hypothetical protein [Polyangiaceae bacterium]
MEVERRIEKLVGRKLVLDLPESFENKEVEVIVLTLETEPPQAKRQPHPSIAGKMVIHGDIFDSVPLEDIEILK